MVTEKAKEILITVNDNRLSEDISSIMENKYENAGCRENNVLVFENIHSSVNTENNCNEFENYMTDDNIKRCGITSGNIKSEFPSHEVDTNKIKENLAEAAFVANIKREYEDEECLDAKATNENADELKVYLKHEIEQNERCNTHNSGMNDEVKIENEVVVKENHNEFDNKFLSCNHSDEVYQNYCTKCRMLVAVLDRHTSYNSNTNAIEDIPKDILEIRKTSKYFQIFATKTISEGVRFGPFSGLYISKGCWKIKRGRFVTNNNKSEYQNWMQHINPARTILQRNLSIFQYGDNIYYYSVREIPQGEELLVYFGEKYEDSLINDLEMDFIPHLETKLEDVFACTFCCLGFGSEIYLSKHKAVCLNKTEGSFLNKDITQCPHCKIYLEQWEYLEHHMIYCRGKHFRQHTSSAPKDQRIVSNKPYNQQREICKAGRRNNGELNQKESLAAQTTDSDGKNEEKFECFLCEYETSNESYLNVHVRMIHFADGKYKCTKCEYETNRKGNMKMHFVKHEEVKQFKCPRCDYATRFKQSLDRHLGAHETVKRYKCTLCAFTTNIKYTLNRHLDTHDDQKRFKCGHCDYATRQQCSLTRHLTTHESISRFKCLKCNYTARFKQSLLRHYHKHETVRRYKCSQCDYAAKYKSNLARHTVTHNSKQLKCSKCDYVTNHKSNLIVHFSTHEAVRRFKCSQCEYAATSKKNLGKHAYKHRTTQLFKCSKCDYVTYQECYLKRHSSRHEPVKQFKCSKCTFETNYKAYLKVHFCKATSNEGLNEIKVIENN